MFFLLYEKMHIFLSINRNYSATISQAFRRNFFYLSLKTRFTVINILSVRLYIFGRKCWICPRHHVYSSDSSSRRCECRKQRGCINISRNSSVESKSSDQQPVLWTSSEMNVRIAHMAHVTIGLTSHAFIIDVVAHGSSLHSDRRRYIARQPSWKQFSYLLWNVSLAISTKRRKLWQSGRRSRERFSTCKMQIARRFLYDRGVAEAVTKARAVKRQSRCQTFTSFL